MNSLAITIRRILYQSMGQLPHNPVDSDIVVFCYHSIANDDWRFSVSPSVFEEQMKALIKERTPITLTDLISYLEGRKELPKKAFLLTFDDGYKNVLSAVPILQKLKIRPVLSVICDTAHVNSEVLGTNKPLLSWKEIRELSDNGWDIASHSGTHPDLSSLPTKELDTEIHTSKKVVEEKIQKAVFAFTYPKGKYTHEVLDAVHAAQYDIAFSMDDGFIDRSVSRFRIPRIGVDRTHSFAEFSVLAHPNVVAIRGFIKRLLPKIAE